MRWYREHGYQFLVLTDHNVLTSVDGLNAVHGADDRFLVVKGEEVSDTFGRKPLHVNGLDVSGSRPRSGSSVVDVVRRNVDATPRQRHSPHQPSQLRLGDQRRRIATGGRTSCSRSTTVIMRSTTSAAAASPAWKKSGIACSRAAKCCTASRTMMRTCSSSRATRTSPARPRMGVRPGRAAGAPADCRGARARRLLRVHRRRAVRLPGGREEHHDHDQAAAREQIPDPVHRPERSDPERGARIESRPSTCFAATNCTCARKCSSANGRIAWTQPVWREPARPSADTIARCSRSKTRSVSRRVSATSLGAPSSANSGRPGNPHRVRRRRPLPAAWRAGPGEDAADQDRSRKRSTCKFNRIQFTPDLMPSDIIGTEVIEEDRATGRA